MEKLTHTYEYLLLLSPDGPTDLKAKQEKKRLKDEFGCSLAANLKPHITLSNFLLFDRMQNRLVGYFDSFAKSMQPFHLEIDGFNHFENHTIFLDVKTKRPVIDMMIELKNRFRRYMMVTERLAPYFPTRHPHMTLARGMSSEQFEKAWPEYKSREFKSSFEINEMLLLKKEAFTQTSYQIVKHFKFTATDKRGGQLKLPF